MPPVVDRGHNLTIRHIGGTAGADMACDLLMEGFVFVELPLRDVLTKISNSKD